MLRSLSTAGSPAALGARIAEAKRRRVSAASADFDPVGDAGGDVGFTGPELDGLTARYDAALRERGMVDVDDLVTLPVAAARRGRVARRGLPRAVDGRLRR